MKQDTLNQSADDPETNPTIDNVLPRWKEPYFRASPVKPNDLGIICAVAGGTTCPWCGAPCEEFEHSYIAVCTRNPKHRVLWQPWGG